MVEFLCNAQNSERQELKLSNRETDHCRESAPLVQVQNKTSWEIHQCCLLKLFLGPIPNKLDFPPVKKALVISDGPAVRDVGSSKSTLSNPLYTKDRSRRARSTLNSDKFDGNPFTYYQFIRQVEDRILNVYGGSDTVHALHLLFDATKRSAHKLIASCVIPSPNRALNEALQLLHKAFGSPQVAVRAFIDSVCEEGVISHSKVGLEIFICA